MILGHIYIILLDTNIRKDKVGKLNCGVLELEIKLYIIRITMKKTVETIN